MACERCESFFSGWRSHGPTFPEYAWEIVEKIEWPIDGPHGMTGFDGKARCKQCGQLADFTCTIPEGFGFSPIR